MIHRTPRQVVQFLKQRKIEFIDLRFMDFPGLPQHCTYPVGELTERAFARGIGFDGSSVRGWEGLNESDMLLVPVAETAVIDPFFERPTAAMVCDIRDPVTRKEYSRSPRSVARKCEAWLKKSGVADEARFGPEAEFFVFDAVNFEQRVNGAHYQVDSVEGVWNRGQAGEQNKGNQIRLREGYFPAPPVDTLSDLRSEMVAILQGFGIEVEGHHHEVATGGQCEIDMRHDGLLRMSDKLMYYKYVARQTAARWGKTATFMPKPLFTDNGSGMHVHFSLFKNRRPLFAGHKYAGLSEVALWAIGGILKHARSLCAFCAPTTNSYKRLVPGYEAPTHMVYASRNRSAAVRIPLYSDEPAKKRLEFRTPDAAANPYLAFAALTMAALDGIQQRIDPGDPMDIDPETLPAGELTKIGHAPANLEEALAALAEDHGYLLAGNVFTKDVVEGWMRYKRTTEIEPLRIRPHPYEFCMYYDV
ncbi:MAG TPA: type I glutamate--ammonia ligase [Phycisphaerae bacterium]|nr:type I glutamate--ammonia ligase [Phycisphaerae bacterium]